jgi:hypothetical protein
MSDEKSYSGHTAQEVIELMGMLAAEHDLRSADEALAIARRGYALLKDQASKLDNVVGSLEIAGKRIAEQQSRLDSVIKVLETRAFHHDPDVEEVWEQLWLLATGRKKPVVHYDPIEDKSTLVESQKQFGLSRWDLPEVKAEEAEKTAAMRGRVDALLDATCEHGKKVREWCDDCEKALGRV